MVMRLEGALPARVSCKSVRGAAPAARVPRSMAPRGGARGGAPIQRDRSVACGGIARQVLEQQREHIEGDPMAFLDVTENYWRVGQGVEGVQSPCWPLLGSVAMQAAPATSSGRHADG
jgi:hypothetical protein